MIDLLKLEDAVEREMDAGKKPKVMRISKQSSPAEIMVDQKQLENVEYFNSLSSVIDDVRCTREIKSRIFHAKEAFNRRRLSSAANWN